MRALFKLEHSAQLEPAVRGWFESHADPLGEIAQRWFNVIRASGKDVWEVMHDGQPTACVNGVAFAYVAAYTSHVNVGFFHGAELSDPKGLLEGSGKFMRHVKIRPGHDIDELAMCALIESAYADIKSRLSNSNEQV